MRACAERARQRERERWDRAAAALTSQRFRSCYTNAIAKTKPGDEPPQPYTIFGHRRLQRPPPRCRRACREGFRCASAAFVGVQGLMFSKYFRAFKDLLTECGNQGLNASRTVTALTCQGNSSQTGEKKTIYTRYTLPDSWALKTRGLLRTHISLKPLEQFF